MRPISLYSIVNRRQRRKQALLQSLKKRSTRAALGCASLALLILVALLLVGSLGYTWLVKDLPSPDLLLALLDPVTGSLLQPTRLYDRTGQIEIASLENPGAPRHYLSLDPNRPAHLSPDLIRAAVGFLDPDYWQSAGVRLGQLTNPNPLSIPERLVSDLLLWREPPGIARALRMRFLAAQVIARYGHVQVLEWYLNSVSFGRLSYGADSAARFYLGKSASAVNLFEATILVAAIQAPALNPLDAPAVALQGQQDILKTLVSRRVISEQEYLSSLTALLSYKPPETTGLSLQASGAGGNQPEAGAFTQQVVDRLAQFIRRDRLEHGGLKVITTLDYNLQMELSCLTRAQLARLTGQPEGKSAAALLPDSGPCQSERLLPALPPGQEILSGDVRASAVVLDPQTGQVLALLGDTSYQGGERQILPHQPGSLLTPFAAVAGFARGIGPASLGWDIPPNQTNNKALQSPDGPFHGPVRMRTALANDYLAPQFQMIDQVGAANVWKLAGAMGLDSLVEEKDASLIYQGGRVAPLELTQAYAVLAAQGNQSGQRSPVTGEIQPVFALYVEDMDGSLWLDAHLPVTQTVISPQLAYLVHNVIADATARRPSLGYPNPLEIGRPSAGKIGRVQGDREMWTAGYTPQRVALFWLGLDGEGEQKLTPKMVAGMWYALMQYANRSLAIQDWPEPPGIATVNVCNPSGLLPTQACPDVVREIFLSGNEPSAVDNMFQEFQINRETGRLATVFTPPELIEEKVFMLVPPFAKDWAAAANLPLPPQEYDAIQPAETFPFTQIDAPLAFSTIHGQVVVKGTAAGDGFRFYQVQLGQGVNPQTWLQIGEDGTAPVKSGVLAAWNTSEEHGLYAIRLLVARADQTVETATIQVTVDNTPPQVEVRYPISEQKINLTPGARVTFQASATDALGLDRVVWFVDGKKVGEVVQEPYIWAWPALTGGHTLQVRAYDRAGNEGISKEVQFIITSEK